MFFFCFFLVFPSRNNNSLFFLSLSLQMSRMGIPPALKCAVWISSVVKSCHPHQPPEYSQQYRTLSKVRQIDHAWETVLKQLFPNPNDEQVKSKDGDFGLTFGSTSYRDYLGGNGPLPDYGETSLQRVLLALHYVVGLEYAPLLPTLAIVSLSFMSESYAYTMLREMAHCSSTAYFPTSPIEHVAWCRAFMDVLQRLHPQTATCLNTCHVETGGNYQGLDPIFKLFFFPILKFVHVLRIMDIYVLEGSKVIFRFGVALLCMFKKDWKVCMYVRWSLSLCRSIDFSFLLVKPNKNQEKKRKHCVVVFVACPVLFYISYIYCVHCVHCVFTNHNFSFVFSKRKLKHLHPKNGGLN